MRKDICKDLFPPDFHYAGQDWTALWNVISQHYTEAEAVIQEKLETCAMRYQVVNELDFSRNDTVLSRMRGDAKAIADTCSHLESLLRQWNEEWVPDDAIAALSKKQKIQDTVFFRRLAEIRSNMEGSAAQGIKYPRTRRQDRYRDLYLSQLCEIWVGVLEKPLAASFNRKSGEASGPCVEFLYRAAKPVLGQFSRNGARRFIQRMKKEERAGTGPLIRLWKTHRHS
jgi:hypothetical protein